MIFEITTKQEKVIATGIDSKSTLLAFCEHSDVEITDVLGIKEIDYNTAVDYYKICPDRALDYERVFLLLAQKKHNQYSFICSLWLDD